MGFVKCALLGWTAHSYFFARVKVLRKYFKGIFKKKWRKGNVFWKHEFSSSLVLLISALFDYSVLLLICACMTIHLYGLTSEASEIQSHL